MKAKRGATPWKQNALTNNKDRREKGDDIMTE